MKPNLLFIMADQFVWNGIGKTGGWAKTPNLDRLMEQSVYFSNCFTTSPLCLPARASLATGLYPRTLGIERNEDKGLNNSCNTWMQAFQREGYSNSLFGKLHVHKWSSDLRDDLNRVKAYGYDIVDEIPGPRTYGKFKSNYYDLLKENDLLDVYNEDVNERYRTKVYCARPSPLPMEFYPDVYVGNQACLYLSTAAKNTSWFCTVSFGGPHEPWDAPLEYVQLYENEHTPPPLPKPVDRNPQRPTGVYDNILNGEYDFALNETVLDMTEQDIVNIRKNYAAKITLIDNEIGRIMRVVEDRGEWDNTIVIFTSDHGEQNGDYGLVFKQTFLNSSVKVPLLIKPHNGFGSHVNQVDSIVELLDIGTTAVEMAGAEIPYYQHGISLCELMKGKKVQHREFALSQLFRETMVCTREYKAVFNQMGQVYMLFDLQADSDERVNLAAAPEYQDIEEKFKNIYQSG